jgi:hypothetical protein
MSTLLAPAAQNREASPIALVVILCLLVATVLLIRSMNKRLRKLPPTFADRDEHGRPLDQPAIDGRPADQLPVDQRPSRRPSHQRPVDQRPAAQPPAIQPTATQPPANQPPAGPPSGPSADPS